MGGPSGRAWGISCPDQRDKERERRLQEARARPAEGRGNLATETTTRHSHRAADGSAVSTVTKTERLVHSSKEPIGAQGGDTSTSLAPVPLTSFLLPPALPDDGTRTARTTTVESSFVRRSESKAAWRRPVPACPPASSGSSSNSLSVFLSVCFSVRLSLSLLCLWLPPFLPQTSAPSLHVQPRPNPALVPFSCRWWWQHHGPNQDLFLLLIQEDGQVSTGTHPPGLREVSITGDLTAHPFCGGVG